VKKVLFIILSLIIFICIGCGKDSYTSKTAIKNGDVVVANGNQYNVEKLDEFMENVKNNIKDKVRITRYTIEGDAIITDLDYDGENINYTDDNTRDSFGKPSIVTEKFEGASIYKNGSKYYLRNSYVEILIY